jgi:hypothetical protein
VDPTFVVWSGSLKSWVSDRPGVSAAVRGRPAKHNPDYSTKADNIDLGKQRFQIWVIRRRHSPSKNKLGCSGTNISVKVSLVHLLPLARSEGVWVARISWGLVTRRLLKT